MTRRSRDERIGLAIALAAGLLLHGGLGVAVYKSPEPVHEDRSEPERVTVQTFQRTVELNKPKPKPKPKPEPKPEPVIEPIQPIKPVEPKPTPKPEAAAKPAKPTTQPKAKQEAAPKKKPRGKRSKKPSKKKSSKPKTLRRTNLGGSSPVKAYEGSEDTFGAPEERPVAENETNRDGPTGDGKDGSKGKSKTGNDGEDRAGGDEAPATPVAPKVIDRVQGRWPSDAPRAGRTISIMLTLRIDETGKVVKAKIRSRPPQAGNYFDDEAVRVAKATKFRPATLAGKAIPFTIRYVVRFNP